jgi:hypothetical protein
MEKFIKYRRLFLNMVTSSLRQNLSRHHRPFLRNIIVSSILIAMGTLFYLKKVGRDVIPLSDEVMAYFLAAGCIIGGLHMLFKTFEFHIVHF